MAEYNREDHGEGCACPRCYLDPKPETNKLLEATQRLLRQIVDLLADVEFAKAAIAETLGPIPLGNFAHEAMQGRACRYREIRNNLGAGLYQTALADIVSILEEVAP